ncbi:hypothetical protein ACFYXM_36765 [Streptomyces sp. NPDC002476]|uniref:hypothetical protein n=1 Tax=Streptomyces sp. NPDC002476 TaxID=3364648 RepID=UPI0036A7AA30
MLALGAVEGEPGGGLEQERARIRAGRRNVDLAQGVDQVRETALAAGLGEVGGLVLVHRRRVRQHPLGNEPVHDLAQRDAALGALLVTVINEWL